MKPRRLFFVFLLIAACGVWVYDITLIFKNVRLTKGTITGNIAQKTLPDTYVYRPDFSDPFFCSRFMSAATKNIGMSTMKSASRKEAIKLPACRIGGIVYTPGNPMAIFVSGDKSQLVKQGDVVDSISIVSIMPQSVEVSYRGKKFTIAQ